MSDDTGRDMLRVLVVDDDATLLSLYAEFVKRFDSLKVETALDGGQALERLQSQDDKIDLLIVDHGLHGLSGLEVAAAARNFNPGLSVLLWSGHCDHDLKSQARDAGVQTCIQKPLGMKETVACIDKILLSIRKA